MGFSTAQRRDISGGFMVARNRRMLSAFFWGAVLASLVCLSGAKASAGLFDAPKKLVRLSLPSDPANPQAKAQLSCFYYPQFMVKEIDLGELGAQQLSITAIASGQARPGCRRENSTDEKLISSDDWSGYFWGVKGGNVFFSAEDGWNGGMGFAVFTATEGKKIFEDAAKTWRSIQLSASGLAMRYQRVYGASCSLRAEEASCWQQIERETGLAGTSPPDCTAAYLAEQKRTPTFAQQVLGDPSVLDYDVNVTIDASAAKIVPVSGKALNCRPAD
jgi:hypothetical protein